ncbi:phosphoribosylamine--glycine ligase [Candidatus Enterococcus willemsii]|uniref:Phosphoribosylamine--glycine ligase n=1 Tax=Candidatus Enterococcus willemsii TaxID=1857215 RepID=A0ABQ6YXS3_9ENTE|nr:phosphoribosylamine--glycine ligase [Enterococcus sp. CU12B]KAF1302776.1 phosphoribosylamine--glycine ligase [Enterococcus sp. CU12B]
MKLLVIGSGGREHAIAKKLLMDKAVTKVYCAKGNPGMIADGIEIVAIEEENHQALIQFAKEEQVDWTFVGPEVPLLNGIVDDFQAEGLKIFGPNRAAAMIEGSKEFAKELMVANYIPTAEYRSFEDFELAKQYVLAKGAPIVIKADGLAAGKGVVVAETEAIAIAALKDMLEENRFGESGAKVVIEEFLAGEEFSLLAFVKDENVYPMVIAQDHKRAFDGDKGPNTGGMGAYSPVPQIPETMVKQAVSQVLRPAAQGMVSRGTPFTGILYAGLIATADGPKVIEFNARFGDPETQVVLPRLESSLAEIITALLVNEEPEIRWNARATLGVVVAAEGYPNEYKKDVVLPIIENDEVNVYYAGVKQEEVLVSSGGRVFLVQSEGETIKEAQEKVYRTLAEHSLEELFYRTDIGDKAFKK